MEAIGAEPPKVLLTAAGVDFDPNLHPWSGSGRSFPGSVVPILGGEASAWAVTWPTRRSLVELVQPWEPGSLQLLGMAYRGSGRYLALAANTSPDRSKWRNVPYGAVAMGAPLASCRTEERPEGFQDDPPMLLVGAVGSPMKAGTPPWNARVRPTPGEPVRIRDHYAWGFNLATATSPDLLVGRSCGVYVGVVEVAGQKYVGVAADLGPSAFRGHRMFPAWVGDLDPQWFATPAEE